MDFLLHSDLCSHLHCHHLSTAALTWKQCLLSALNRCRVETVSQRRYINYMASQITQHCCCVNLSRALKARSSEFTWRRKKALLWTDSLCAAKLRLYMMLTQKKNDHNYTHLVEIFGCIDTE